MSSSRGVRSVNRCPTHVDELDCSANNCRWTPAGSVNARQRRNARRAATFRNNQAASVPLPVPVRVTQAPPKPDFRLPNGQVWVRRNPTEFAAKGDDADDAVKVGTLIDAIPEINADTKLYRVLVGFVAVSDGIFAFVRDVGDDIPNLPVVGRVGFTRQTYRSRSISLNGAVASDCRNHAFLWSLNDHKRDARRVVTADYWFAISKPAMLMPPEDFLENSN